MNRLALLFLTALSACTTGETQPLQPMFLGTPRPVGPPRRVVSLAPNLTEILFALGVGDRVVGVTRYDDYPPQVESLPKVGGFIDPSLEAILALRPDLVVCVPNPGGRNRMEALSSVGTPVFVLPANGLEDVFSSIGALGALFLRDREAKKLLSEMRERIDNLTSLAKGKRSPRTLLVYGHKPLVAAGKGSFGDGLLNLAGGENVVGNSRVPYPNLPMEVVIRLEPEVIIDASMSGIGSEMSGAEVREFWRDWPILPAVKNQHLYLFDSSIWFRAGPRIVDGLEQLTRILHPESFPVSSSINSHQKPP